MRALPFLLLLPGLALAQTGLIVQPAVPPRGVTLPPTSAALVDEATALSVNPAGLRFIGPGQLFYLHERDLARDQLGDGLFLGTSLFGGLGVGFSLEWMRGHGLPDYRKTSFGLALGSGKLSLGAGYHNISSRDGSLDRLYGWDLGLTVRPARYLSVGAVVKDVNAPSEGPYTMPRSYNLAVGVRPFGERLTLGADYLASEGNWGDGRLSYTLQGTVISGVRLGAGLSHGLGTDNALALQFSLTLDSSNFGLTYAGGGAESGGLDHVVAVRVSSQRYPNLQLGGGSVALVDLDDQLVERGGLGLPLIGGSGEDPFIRLMRWMDEATKDPRLKGVLLKVSGLPGVDWAKADELRQAVLRMRAAGKRVMAVLYSVDDRAYFVGSAADEVYALPASSLLVNGLAASILYLGGTMEKLGVTWDVARVGDYKTAPEQFTRKDLSPAERETVEAYLDAQTAHDVEAVTTARHITPERLREAWTAGILTAVRAKELGLVDGVLLPEELDSKLKTLVPGAHYNPYYAPHDERDPRWSGRRRIAVVPVLGTIAGGKSRKTPLAGEAIAGAETVALALERAQRDPSVVAIVLRVDSGGGDVLASELMYRAVLEAKKYKPVIASMGDVAASGGYYTAMGADEIWASPTTLTGSIGVFFVKPALRGLLGDKLGANEEIISRAPMATLLNSWNPWTEAEQKAVQAWVNSAYDDFITQVSVSRKLDKTKVDSVARGRVWTGAAAKERGLVDQMGGLMDAITSARKRAGVPSQEELELKVLGEPGGLFSSLGGEPGVDSVLRPAETPALPPGVQALVRDSGLDTPWLLEPGLKAVQPFTLTVR
ncbi:signal peptide peptidase SppA [Vitiosangium sp. GDMCC 1.1324]|uniref:signal peptide peptidase SppA n=1 Tax=Vitiosangium sp. (strain GDMCC 1.1324) TaxID=2138576 RepID=UPI000D34FFD0|nr:signal peptide peptidase SppA [Vitiosangium sp. GDMCC 1.1324]PTL80455.1 signal peptide peptidase SppA [Vitiosangium sp. GDMCC 1.1324]